MNFLIRLVLSAIAVLIASYLLPGVTVDSFFTAIVVAAVIALLNATIKPILVIFTIPITVVTLGLFLLVINALMFMLADWLIPGFVVDGFWWAVIFSIILSILNALLGGLSRDHDR